MTCTVRYRTFKPRKGEAAKPHKLICDPGKDKRSHTLLGDADAFFDEIRMVPGVTRLTLPSSMIGANGSIDLDGANSSDISIANIEGRAVSSRIGTHKVLVIRVTDSSTGTAPTVDTATLAADMFTDARNLVRSQTFISLLLYRSYCSTSTVR